MKRTLYPFLKCALLLLFAVFSIQSLNAQAQVNCADAVVVLDENGMATITYDIVNASSDDPFTGIEVIDPALGTNVVTCAEAGMTVMVQVSIDGNNCMSLVTVQEKLIPTIDCAPVVIACDEDDSDAATPSVSDNCPLPAGYQPTGSLMSMAAGAPVVMTGFDGIFTPANATFTTDNPGEEAGFNGDASELTLVGANAGGDVMDVCLTGGLDDPECFTVTACFPVPVGGSLQFDWTNEGGDAMFDPTGYSITDEDGNISYFYLSNSGTTSGTQTVSLNADEVLCFLIASNGVNSVPTAVFSNLIYTMDAATSCGPDYLVKQWTATDANGNTNTCKQIIVKEVLPFEDITFPASFTHPCATPYATDADGNPAASFTGVPTGCNISYLVKDVFTITPSACGAGPSGCSSIKIEWQVWDLCNLGTDSTHFQIITFEDNTAPTIAAIPDQTISTAVWTCVGSILLPEPSITDDCSTVGTYSVSVDAGAGSLTYLPAVDRWSLSDIPVGTWTITYTASDCCGNPATQTFELTVEDQVPPVAVCNTGHTTSITVGGTAKVFASSFDDGSHDNCGPVHFKVIRMDDLLGTTNGSFSNQNTTDADIANGDDATSFGNQIFFDDAVLFDCADIINSDLMVVFRVFDVDPGPGPVTPSRMGANGDLFGRYNDCMVPITVEDKLAPIISCPDNVTISCEFWYDVNNLAGTFGTVVTDIADRVTHTHTDPGNGNSISIKDGVAYDNCNVTVSESNPVINLTCGVGTITRVFTATDDFGKTTNCIQTITVQDDNPFTGSDIVFPSDYTSNNCGQDTDPSVTGEPIISNDDVCSSISVVSTDELFTVVPDACLKIKRTWKVTDWCTFDQFDSDNNGVYDATDNGVIPGQWQAIQYIKVLDGVAPIFNNCADQTVNTDANVCSYQFNFTIDAVDACAGTNLNVDWKVDLGNDATTWDLSGNSTTINVSLGVGTHEVLWSAEDGCGNTGTCTQFITVEDNETPNIKLVPNKTVGISNPNDTYVLTAAHLESGSTDACGAVSNFLIVFPSAGFGSGTPPSSATTSVTLDCGDADNAGTSVDIWGQDIYGNWGMATTVFTLQYNGMLPCGNTPPEAMIAGEIESELGEEVEAVMVDIGMNAMAQTNNNGDYEISAPTNSDYIVAPEKLDAVREGLSTLDLVLISRHMIGLQPLTSPYKLIAADVNGDDQIDPFDLIDLQQVILFINDVFPNDVPSWRFIDAAFEFENANDPFASAFPESYLINGLSQDMMHVDFLGIKVGDVNNSAVVNTNQVALPRNFVGEFPMVKEQTTEGIVIRAAADLSLEGMQMTLQVTDAISAVRPGALAMTAKNMQSIAEGVYNVSLATGKAVTVAAGEVLFTLITATDAADLTIGDRGLQAEVYSASTLELLQPVFEGNQLISQNRLYQNQPNPFKQQTSILFELQEASAATLSIYDVSGKILHVVEGDFAKGLNEITLTASQLATTGVVYYQLSTDAFTATRKMIITN